MYGLSKNYMPQFGLDVHSSEEGAQPPTEEPAHPKKQGFVQRVQKAIETRGHLCAGVDPHPELLDAWNLPKDASGLASFAFRCVDAFAESVAAIKFQVAFFEAYGPDGLTALQVGLEAAAKTGMVVIADAKRGDIESTLSAYTAAWLAPDAPFLADAVTVSSYLGVGALLPAVEAARLSGKGVITLAATSNREAYAVQNARLDDGRTVAQSVVDEVAAWNNQDAHHAVGGVVVGATLQHGLDLSHLHGVILAPGFGAQGATEEKIAQRFPEGREGLLVATSRSLLREGPAVPSLRAAATRFTQSLEAVLKS